MRAVVVCLAALAAPALAAAAEKPALVLEVIAPKEVYPDEPIDVKAVIHNTGKEDAYVVRAIDGSFDRLRSVVDYKWVVKKGADRVPRRSDVVRIDSQVNSLDDADVLLVKAGKQADPQAHGFGQFSQYHDLRVPGKYTIALSYELNPGGREKGSDTANQLIQKQPAVLIESKAVEVTVLPFPPARRGRGGQDEGGLRGRDRAAVRGDGGEERELDREGTRRRGRALRAEAAGGGDRRPRGEVRGVQEEARRAEEEMKPTGRTPTVRE